MSKNLIPQSKATLIEAPGVAFVIQTDDQSKVVLTPQLAVELAQKILFASGLCAVAENSIPAKTRLVQ